MKSQIQNTIKQFDLFSKPFAFFVGNKKTKSTLVGGFLSLSVITVSIVYFYYLMDLYFSNQIQPKITQQVQIQSNLSQIHIQDSFFIMEMLVNGQPLKQYEKSVNQVYLNYTVSYEVYYPNGTSNSTNISLVECVDPTFKGYLCIDEQAFEQNIDIFNNPIQQLSSDFAIQISLCDPTVTTNCAPPDEIANFIFQPQNYFQLFTKIKQYNPNQRQYETAYKSEYFYFDPNMITYTRLDLILATTSVSNGYFIQKTSTDVNIYDYQRIDTFFSTVNVEQRMGISGLGYIVYELNQVHNQISIQNAMVTEVLAQFMSIFNAMLFVGFLARYLAESYIIEDMNNIMLQEYYKKTALKLVQKKEIKNALQKFGKADAAAQSQLASSYNILNIFSNSKDSSPEKQKSKVLCEVQKKIYETDFSEQQKQYFEISFCQRIKSFFNKILGFDQSSNIQKDPNSDPTLYSNLLKQSMKRINIFEVYKDLIKLKMAIKLILTKDQYAAMLFCGSDLCIQETQKESQTNEGKSQKVEDQIKSGNNKDNLLASTEKNQPINNEYLSKNQKSNTKIASIFFQERQSPNCQDEDRGQIKNEVSLEKICQVKSNYAIENVPQDQLEQIKSDRSIFQDFQQNQALSKDEQLNIFETNDNLMRQIKSQILLNQTSPNNQIHQVSLNKKDDIQNLKINGDQNVLNQSDLSIEISNTAQDAKDNIQQKDIQNLQTIFGLSCHLAEMDQIEENEEEKEKYLKEFFVKMKNPCQSKVNHIDQQIYQSLIINEKQVKEFNKYVDQQIVTNRRITLDSKKNQISKLIIELNNNSQQNVNQKMQ
ncbi:transmembrane protein, putative (macronuclear) [Tetrahymena thermophila SB210]|uniref:Transmembrane protein, putative n=1 Tax=Tetrahymena thermophila (strain SB210) TaxID=312017 RepID=Q23CX9_TETTS|nr:transmembrane protein, putative [Tetrahymena thermophila SB210]EAR94342.2 transmembrane protein, putative [Tetrahymena thermophila SB210]|eukprot:XP_001014907.2 transmembrane protein, putative [Tetrahymena thermophila SB210]